ncbi:MAG: radical SAM protein [Acidobacteria bacterium]|nr:MAG: radical SAM protein [Acidobacteriota bacterium]
MSKTIYLINPASDFPTYFTAEVYAASNYRPATLMADLAIPTLAAMIPNDVNVVLCDENVSRIDFDSSADFIGITGKISQQKRMIEIARKFRQRGKVLLMGGPCASLAPETLREHCDILVRGEAEEIMDQLLADLKSSCWKEEYVGSKPELSKTPVPKWGLYPNDRAVMGTLQTSRGCPFECEFCDVIQYLGRRQRHKPSAHVVRELDELYRWGYRNVFVADDNFTVYRSRTKELLAVLHDWNARQQTGKVAFVTQVSIDAARDAELLQMCAKAGVTNVFVGIETPNEDSLRETKKRQNLGVNLANQVQRFLDHGIAVTAGMIVGFDSDGRDIFARQYEFAMSTAIPIFSTGALVAPAATPLHSRMAQEGRLVAEGTEVAAMPWSTNIEPRQMTREQLLRGLKWLCTKLYQPAAFGERVLRFIDRLGPRVDPRSTEPKWLSAQLHTVDTDSMDLLGNLIQMGRDEALIFSKIQKGIARKPESADFVIPMLLQYVQIRYLYDRGGVWDPLLASRPSPFA